VVLFEENQVKPMIIRSWFSAARLTTLALLTLGWSALAPAKDIALISNKANHVDAVSLADLVKICKGQTGHWPDGKMVTLVIRDPGSPEMKLVLQKVYAMPKQDVAAVIASANHNRLDHPAIVVADSDATVIEKVQSTVGAVGLVDVYAITSGVTVVRVEKKLPLEPGYALHGN
jgi:hypothetical protein